MKRSDIQATLKDAICNVRFTKVDGSTRILCCTLNPDHIPKGDETPVTKPKNQKPINENVLAVWDLDELRWKSFRISNVEKVDILQGARKDS